MVDKVSSILRQATEKAAVAVLPYFGKMDKHTADHIAVETMRKALNDMDLHSRIIIGEGEKDNAPMLYEGEMLGHTGTYEIDIAVDPLECTTNFSRGLPNSMSIIAFSERGGLRKVPGTYMEQWLAGPDMKENFEPEKGVRYNIEKLCKVENKGIGDLVIVVQDRPRHEGLIRELRDMGCGVSLIESGSISAAMDITLRIGTYDAMIGTYGAPEGLICAAMAVATNSEMKAILRPHNEEFQKKWIDLGGKENQVMDKKELIHGEHLGLVATGISGNHFLKGLQKRKTEIQGHTLIISTEGIGIHTFSLNR
ncbi:MAG: fructose-bisphosphatase class II [Leptospiraceae bacterium]|nr:fructose-bisphosphatase class II [Leptospiraceae bacterium]MCP5501175.1 fructose-bisphosphatase class II [Leptospiraceae bacterium]